MRLIGLNDGPFLVFTLGIDKGTIVIADDNEFKFPTITLDTFKSSVMVNSLKSLFTGTTMTSFSIHIAKDFYVKGERHEDCGNETKYTLSVISKDYEVIGTLPNLNNDLLAQIEIGLHL